MSSIKTIGFWSGIQLLINNTVGPALVLLPSLFQQYGYFSVLSLLLMVSLFSVISAWMLSQTLHHYITSTKHKSYITLEEQAGDDDGITLYQVMHQYISNNYILKSILSIYIIALIFRLMEAIIQSGQIIDLLICNTFSKSCALSFSTQGLSIICHSELPFDATQYVLSLGFIFLLFICFILFRNINFDNIVDSIWLQWFANIVVVLLLCIWLYIFITEDAFQTNRISLFYDSTHHNSYHVSHIVSIICANYAFIIPIPSWYAQRDTNVTRALMMKTFLYSIIFVFILFTLIGVFGGMAYKPKIYKRYDDNLFDVLDESEHAGILGKMSVYAFPVAQNITTIPVLCIIVAYNIKNFGIHYRFSLMIAIIAPWILSLLFFNGDGFNIVCDYASLFITIINFIVPPLMYMKMLRMNSQIADAPNEYFADEAQGETTGFLHASKENQMEAMEVDADDAVFDLFMNLFDKHAFKTSYTMIAVSSFFIIVIVYGKVFL